MILVLLVDEFLGVLAMAMAYGDQPLLQLLALVTIGTGAIYVFRPGRSRGAFWVLVLAPAALGVYGVAHIVRVAHPLGVQVVVAAQACVRLGAAVVLESSRAAKAFCAEAARRTK